MPLSARTWPLVQAGIATHNPTTATAGRTSNHWQIAGHGGRLGFLNLSKPEPGILRVRRDEAAHSGEAGGPECGWAGRGKAGRGEWHGAGQGRPERGEAAAGRCTQENAAHLAPQGTGHKPPGRPSEGTDKRNPVITNRICRIRNPDTPRAGRGGAGPDAVGTAGPGDTRPARHPGHRRQLS